MNEWVVCGNGVRVGALLVVHLMACPCAAHDTARCSECSGACGRRNAARPVVSREGALLLGGGGAGRRRVRLWAMQRGGLLRGGLWTGLRGRRRARRVGAGASARRTPGAAAAASTAAQTALLRRAARPLLAQLLRLPHFRAVSAARAIIY